MSPDLPAATRLAKYSCMEKSCLEKLVSEISFTFPHITAGDKNILEPLRSQKPYECNIARGEEEAACHSAVNSRPLIWAQKL